jgi:hypothetical protein
VDFEPGDVKLTVSPFAPSPKRESGFAFMSDKKAGFPLSRE